jgi:hypothetical protein
VKRERHVQSSTFTAKNGRADDLGGSYLMTDIAVPHPPATRSAWSHRELPTAEISARHHLFRRFR